jgi:hypothetical protein
MKLFIILLVGLMLVGVVVAQVDTEDYEEEGGVPQILVFDENGENPRLIDAPPGWTPPTDAQDVRVECDEEPCVDQKFEKEQELKEYYDWENYDSSKDYNLLTFPMGGTTVEYQQRFEDYFGFSLTEEEGEQLFILRSRLGFERFAITVAGDDVRFEPFPEIPVDEEEYNQVMGHIETFKGVLQGINQQNVRDSNNVEERVVEPATPNVQEEPETQRQEQPKSSEKTQPKAVKQPQVEEQSAVETEPAEAILTEQSKPPGFIERVVGFFTSLFGGDK